MPGAGSNRYGYLLADLPSRDSLQSRDRKTRFRQGTWADDLADFSRKSHNVFEPHADTIARAKINLNILFQHPIARYLFSMIVVMCTFALRLWLIPLIGTGAPFVLFFAAVLVTSLAVGSGPGVCAVVLSLPLGAC
jgi:K+-sensing histidine kinase KdpD